ncbi:extracellular matrix glycoprotein pherophorin-V33 [Volvox carteri f. nagariensis]|uniref:Extracellular matrix glycoprotein pherophorin-V33 n=1 Tax=Volvox carteri f. nagariensis TaxID=3068 RepID=D8U827_VOLCA|nr:extracellular matrix glycoprotein pherophorin-V33 [Volvox carteri f. nagariensis]EFJ44193.1 extracellular matrix glycoprotein pherophorin-V33 [Volvox carteri f. nagariensis]|eukprot:XP_002954787.1 extracellular matrix glycoprotein pherophorin-V33 [Volvox carteri f. nagariensis]
MSRKVALCSPHKLSRMRQVPIKFPNVDMGYQVSSTGKMRPRYNTAAIALLVASLCYVNAERSLLQSYLESFPPYGCNRDPQQSRFRLDPVYTVSGNRVCMTARVVDCAKPGSDCCDPKIDFYKIELDVNKQCKGAVTGVTVNGKPALAPTFDPYATNDTKAVIKLTGLNLDLTTADGAVVCMTLGGSCPSMETLCAEGNGFCKYAVVQSGTCDCCPLQPHPAWSGTLQLRQDTFAQ